MKFWLALATVAMFLFLPSRSADAQKRFFPADMVDSVWWSDLIDDEPVLSKVGSLDGFKTRFRLSISGIVIKRALIRIDEKANGEGVGRVAIVRPAARWPRSRDLVADVDRTFRVSAEDMKALHDQIAATKLWNLVPQEHWVSNDPNDICIDGEQLVFERLDAGGYRLSEGNAQCTIPPSVRDVARTIITLSGERWPLGLLQ